MPISANSVVQTGPNTHAGGLKVGFTSSAYQLSPEAVEGLATDGIVTRDPTTPALSDTAIAIINLKKLLIFI